jgi:hypothetical protein
MEWAWAVALKPFVLFIFFVVLVLPLKLLFQKIIPEGKIKRFLFWQIPK